MEEQGTWASHTRKHSEADYGRPVDRGAWTAKTVKRPRQQPAHPQYANYWAPLTSKRHTMPHSAQPQHTNYWALRTRKRHQQEHRPQRPIESSNPTQHAKGRTGDCPGPHKGTTTRRNVTQGGTSPPFQCIPAPQPPPPPPPGVTGHGRHHAVACARRTVMPSLHAADSVCVRTHTCVCRSQSPGLEVGRRPLGSTGISWRAPAPWAPCLRAPALKIMKTTPNPRDPQAHSQTLEECGTDGPCATHCATGSSPGA